MEPVDVGSMPAEAVIHRLLEGDNLRRLAEGHGVACFALPGVLHSRDFYAALIEHSAEIDATTRHHVMFIVFYGNRSGMVRRIKGYGPHGSDALERDRLEGLSTSNDATIEDPKFSSDLADKFRFRPGEIDRPRLHHSMSDCARVLLDRFAIPHAVEPCLLFVDPQNPTSHCIVALDDEDPLRSFLLHVLEPMSGAFRELSAYWRHRDQARERLRALKRQEEIVSTTPHEILRLTASLETLHSEGLMLDEAQERELLTGLLQAFDGEWRDADLRLRGLPGSEELEEDLKGFAASREYCADIMEKLAPASEVADHRSADQRRELQKSLRRSRNKRLSKLGQLRKRLSDRLDGITERYGRDRDQLIESTRRQLDRERSRLERAKARLAGHDPAEEEAQRKNLEEQEANFHAEGYSIEVLDSDRPSAFTVIETLMRTGRIGVPTGRVGSPDEKIRILFLASNPLTTGRLYLEEELRAVDLELRSVRYRDDIVLTAGHAVRPDDLVRLLRQERPTIVHFSGHGSPEGIVLRVDGGHIAVSGEALARLFRDRNVALLVLNACFSEVQASLLREVVPVVVGTTDEVGDEAARRFSAAFYRTLGDGHTLKDAFRDGGDAVAVHELDDVFLAHGDLEKRLCGQIAAE